MFCLVTDIRLQKVQAWLTPGAGYTTIISNILSLSLNYTYSLFSLSHYLSLSFFFSCITLLLLICKKKLDMWQRTHFSGLYPSFPYTPTHLFYLYSFFLPFLWLFYTWIIYNNEGKRIFFIFLSISSYFFFYYVISYGLSSLIFYSVISFLTLNISISPLSFLIYYEHDSFQSWSKPED